MTPQQIHEQASALESFASRFDADAERYGRGGAEIAAALDAVPGAATAPDAEEIEQRGRQVLERVDGVPRLLTDAAVAVRTAACRGYAIAEGLATLQRQRTELLATRPSLLLGSSQLLDPQASATFAAERAEFDRRLRSLDIRIDEQVESWRTECRRADGTVSGVASELGGVARGISYARLGRGVVTAGGYAYGTVRTAAQVESITGAGQVLAGAGSTAIRQRQVTRASERLVQVQDRYRQTASMDAYRREHHPGANRQERRQIRAQDRRTFRSQVRQQEVRLADARAAQASGQPLTRAGARARSLLSSPVARGASRFLGPAGVVIGIGDMAADVSAGNYGNAALTAVGLIGAAAMVAFPVAGAAVVLGTAIVQNREAIANGAKWVGNKLKGLFGRG